MKPIMFALAGVAAIAAAATAQAADKVTLQLKWVTQAQFAGYYVAKDKGFYKQEGLDVTIRQGGALAGKQVGEPARARGDHRISSTASGGRPKAALPLARTMGRSISLGCATMAATLICGAVGFWNYRRQAAAPPSA